MCSSLGEPRVGLRARTQARPAARPWSQLPPPPPPSPLPTLPSGIGFACAQALGRAGAQILLADVDAEGVRQAEQRLAAEGVEAASVVCDVGDKQQVCLSAPS